MSRVRVAVLVSGGGTNLQQLINSAAAGRLPHAELAAVISSSGSAYALKRAAAANIPSVTVERSQLDAAAFEAGLQAMLRHYQAEVVVLAGFMHILSPIFVAQWPERMLNVHPALIPSFCGKGYFGLHVHEAALARGVKVTGATVHLVNEIPDGGRILLQRAVAVEPGDTPESLQRRVMEQAEWQLLPQAVEQLCAEVAAEKERQHD